MSQATDLLQAYITAETAILAGQMVRFNGRILTRANLLEVQQGRREWQRRVASENQQAAGGGTIRYQVPDFT